MCESHVLDNQGHQVQGWRGLHVIVSPEYARLAFGPSHAASDNHAAMLSGTMGIIAFSCRYRGECEKWLSSMALPCFVSYHFRS